MIKRVLKRLLPDSMHPVARSLRWWMRYLWAPVIWKFACDSKGLTFRLLDAWHRLVPPSLRRLKFEKVAAPEISVVIPVHNHFRFTARCLRSLGRATVDHSFEILVVDDSSSDGTAEKLSGIEGLRVVENTGERGFVAACNAGAEQARARFLVFLNNDTTVEDGWLDGLVTTFDDFPNAGAVGAKLVFPDGRLQEAGGIVWRDGSAWNYGRWMKPDAPRFNYARRVDYCSAACLMMPRSLFEDLGGFDPAFAPGYYEDTDLAFRVDAAGYGVYYQPTVRVRHYEGATAGRSSSAGMKQHQAAHRELFYERWRERLRDHRPPGLEPELEKERTVERRLLLIEPRMIRPDRDSGSLRMFNLMRILREQGYRLTFVPDNLLREEPYVSRLQAMGIEVLFAPFVPSLEAHLRTTVGLYDVILLSRLEVAQRHIARARGYCPGATILYDTVDLHFLREAREADLENNELKREGASQTKQDELAVAWQADATIVVSEVEKRFLLAENPALEVFVVSNIHEQFRSDRGFGERQDILFIGGFEHPPNIDAVQWLVGEVLPRARTLGLEAHTYLIGSHPPKQIRELESEHVTVAGFVPDVGPFFERCRLSVAPLRYGAGVKGKVNQSMALGLPVVATSMACEGMGLEHERDVLIGDGAADLAAAVHRLYQDEALWSRLVRGGRRNIERHYSFEAARAAIHDVLSFATAGVSDSPIWTVEQVAAFLKISVARVSTMVDAGHIPYVEFAGEVRFHRPDLESWVAQGARVPAADSASEISLSDRG